MEKWRTLRDHEKYIFSDDPIKQEEELAKFEQLKDFSEARTRLSSDPYRPIYHFVRPDSSINDPNGLCFWEGRWHLFYQAGGPDCIHWGHAVSEDLVYWRDLPYAIYPEKEPYCFSGGTYVDEENHRVIAAHYGYTGYNFETGYKCGTMIAVSSDPLLLNWTKINDGEAVIPDCDAPCWTPPDAPPVKGQKPYQVFDSFIWKEDGVYYILEAGYDPDPATGRRFRQMHLLRCTNDDLLHWEYVKPFLENDRFREVGDDGACPYFVPIGDKYLLAHFSHRCVPKYLIGDYNKETNEFLPQSAGRFTSGYNVLVAPSVYPCHDGSAVVIFNTPERHPLNGWYGIMTLPRRLRVGGTWHDELYMSPAADYSSLHASHKKLENIALKEGEVRVLEGIEGKAFETVIRISSDNIPPTFELELLRSPDGSERTVITFFKESGGDYAILPYTKDSVIMLDTSHCSVRPEFRPLPPEIAPVVKERGEELELHVFADMSVAEVFVNNKQCICMRTYPSREDSTGVALRSRGTDCVIDSIDFWTMNSIY